MENTLSIKILHSGFDGLDLSYRAFLPAYVLEILRTAKEDAAKTKRPVSVELAGYTFFVSESGAKGGYKFIVDTGELGAVYFFKEEDRSDPWGCRVSHRSLPLALFGAAEAKRRSEEFLSAMGFVIVAGICRVSRVDFALDLLLPEFELRRELFVAHSRSAVVGNDTVETYGSTIELSGIRIGKMPNRQLAVYDKRADILAKKKWYWWDIWEQNVGHAISRENTVWRFEVRAGRNAIDSYFQNTTWEFIGHCLGNLLFNVTQKIRMIDAGADTNRSRSNVSEIWETVQRIIREIPMDRATLFDPRAILTQLEIERREQLKAQLFGLEMSLAAAMGYDPKNYDVFLIALSAIRDQYISPTSDEFCKKFDRKREDWSARFS